MCCENTSKNCPVFLQKTTRFQSKFVLELMVIVLWYQEKCKQPNLQATRAWRATYWRESRERREHRSSRHINVTSKICHYKRKLASVCLSVFCWRTLCWTDRDTSYIFGILMVLWESSRKWFSNVPIFNEVMGRFVGGGGVSVHWLQKSQGSRESSFHNQERMPLVSNPTCGQTDPAHTGGLLSTGKQASGRYCRIPRELA